MLDKVEDDCGVFWLDLSLISLNLLRIVSSRMLTRSTIYHIIVPRHLLLTRVHGVLHTQGYDDDKITEMRCIVRRPRKYEVIAQILFHFYGIAWPLELEKERYVGES